MKISSNVQGFSPSFEMVRSNDTLTIGLTYSLSTIDYMGRTSSYGLASAYAGNGSFTDEVYYEDAVTKLSFSGVASIVPNSVETIGYLVDDYNDNTNIAWQATLAFYSEATTYSGTDTIDVVFGSGFADTLRTGKGADFIEGGAGNDTLDGGFDVDRMVGGTGNDTYYVDQLGDAVVEMTGQGTDKVFSKFSYTLAAGTSIEELRTTNDAATTTIDLRGNELANRIAGNAGSNLLSGLAGNDTLAGYAGNDRLVGGLGADLLYGHAGNDVFVFDTTAESGITATTRDRIMDFKAGDLIDVSDIDASTISSGNQAFALDTNASFSAHEIRQTLSGGNLLLEFNTDGDAAAEMSILVLGSGLLASTDFIL